MTEKERLLHTLFADEGRRHLNIKFSRGSSDDIPTEGLCREVNSAFLQIRAGLAPARSKFGDSDIPTVDVKTLYA